MKPHWLVGLALLPIGFVLRKLRQDPQFGADAGAMKRARKLRAKAPLRWKMGGYRNLEKTPIKEDFSSLLGDLYGYLQAKNTQPGDTLPIAVANAGTVADPAKDYLTWYGHSALRIETGGRAILLDPMLGAWVAPVPFLGHRFPYKDYNPVGELGEVDLVVYSHDHYDHLDYDTFVALKDRVKHYLTPLGVGAHLVAWGVPETDITELDWWESARLAGCQFTLTPARHFSGRSPGTRNQSLWGGFAITTGRGHKLYFGGDSGYGRHFKAIGERLGPFDLTMLDCGQYHDRWRNVHMQPEEALRAHEDLGGCNLLPIHWGAFSLSDHGWSDPVERIIAADEKAQVISPMVGQRIDLDLVEGCSSAWWKADDADPGERVPGAGK